MKSKKVVKMMDIRTSIGIRRFIHTAIKECAGEENKTISEMTEILLLESLKKRGYVFVSEGDNL